MLKRTHINQYMIDIILALGALAMLTILFLFSIPTLPDIIHYPLILIFSLGFFVFVGFVWRGKHNDEREEEHDAYAGKIAYTVGIAIATAGIAVQSFYHSLDAWLIAVLAVMVVIRMCSLIYARLFK